MHAAIVHRDLPSVKLLVEHGASLSPRASGYFFYTHPKLYFGGTLLGLAACLDEQPIVEYLLTNPHRTANPNARDLGPKSGSVGKQCKHAYKDNSILHCLVLHERWRVLTC